MAEFGMIDVVDQNDGVLRTHPAFSGLRDELFDFHIFTTYEIEDFLRKGDNQTFVHPANKKYQDRD